MTNLYELLGRPVVLFDTETTGVNVRTDRILEIAAIRWDQGGRTEFHTLVNPGPDVVIPPGATEKHGITRERLEAENAPPTMQALQDFARFYYGISLFAGHNVPYDIGILNAELERQFGFKVSPLRYDFICTNALAIFTGTGIMRPNRGGYMQLGTKLEEVAAALNLTLEGAHQAANDIAMTEMVLPALYQRAIDQTRPILNAMVHRQWLVDRGVTRPDYVPPRAVIYLVA